MTICLTGAKNELDFRSFNVNQYVHIMISAMARFIEHIDRPCESAVENDQVLQIF
jgi:hypothetical protein